MALVTISYNAWDHNRQVVPAALQPEVWFRPIRSSLANGLMTEREVKGTLDPTTGAGSVQLESVPGIMYVPTMRWLIDASQANETVQNRAHGYCEWQPIYPGTGGSISQLPDVVNLAGIWYGFGAPPTAIRSRNDVIYFNISGSSVGVWAPENAGLPEGVVL